MPRSPGRTGHKWRQAVARLRVPGARCWICGHEIDLDIKHPDPMSFSVDHVTALSRGGDPLDPANHRPAHLGCNSSRGVGTPTFATSREWA